MRICYRYGASLLPQGGNTGLVGGGVPAADGPAPVIVSTRRLTGLGPVDQASGQVTAGAGTTVGDLRRHAAAAGWQYGVDLASRESATVGGTIATNAGGIRVCAYGMTRAQVRGIEAVLPNGAVVSHLSGLAKDNTGYDLAGLLTGSEGTLGIVTAARLRLVPPEPVSALALVGVAGYAAALDVLAANRRSKRLLAAEIMDRDCVELVCAVSGLPWPVRRRDWPQLLLIEVAGDLPELSPSSDAVVAHDATDRARLWSYRERASEAIATLGVVHKYDVSLPLGRLPSFVAALPPLLATLPGVTHWTVFGHLADGNPHIEVVGPEPSDSRCDLPILRLVADHGGSISAEHGIGRAKAPFLKLSRSAAEIEAMKAVKAAWDPQGLFAPGVLFPRL